MTREQAIEILIREYIKPYDDVDIWKIFPEVKEALDMAIEALKQESKFDRLYDWLNDMRLGIAPDETTPDDERGKRQAQVDLLDVIIDWMVEQ